jgi:NADH:ubiquinone reductase (H+-translocating)
VVAYGIDHVDPERDIRILLIDAVERVLPELPERISEAARRLLDKMAAEILTNARAVEVTADGLRMADGSFIPSELIVWAAGVKAPEVLRGLDGLEVNQLNQLAVEQNLQTSRDPDIFARSEIAPPARARGTRGRFRPWRRHPRGVAYGSSNRAPVAR